MRRVRGDWTADELQEFWRDPPGKGNRPEAYLSEVTAGRSELLLDLLRPLASEDAPLLEVGCNVGRNLNALHEAGFRDLTAIEINSGALDLLREQFPELARDARLINSSVEEAAPQLGDDEFRVVYTMAVLEHIHTASEWIFEHMVRAASHAVITIEDERMVSWRHFVRNYREVFEGLGMVQVEELQCGPEHGLDSGFVARVFQHPPRGE